MAEALCQMLPQRAREITIEVLCEWKKTNESPKKHTQLHKKILLLPGQIATDPLHSLSCSVDFCCASCNRNLSQKPGSVQAGAKIAKGVTKAN